MTKAKQRKINLLVSISIGELTNFTIFFQAEEKPYKKTELSEAKHTSPTKVNRVHGKSEFYPFLSINFSLQLNSHQHPQVVRKGNHNSRGLFFIEIQTAPEKSISIPKVQSSSLSPSTASKTATQKGNHHLVTLTSVKSRVVCCHRSITLYRQRSS